jgi:hypothetical protein
VYREEYKTPQVKKAPLWEEIDYVAHHWFQNSLSILRGLANTFLMRKPWEIKQFSDKELAELFQNSWLA